MSESTSTTSRPLPPDPLIGQVLAGRFQVLAAIGAGGAARVYRSVQMPMNRQVALKVVKLDAHDEDREIFEARFLREAAQAGRLSHPNIVTVYDYGRTEDGYCFLAMEMLEGVSMRRLLDGSPVAPERAVRLALGIARGLRHAHGRGMVHRDVKPSNVFLVKDDEGNEVPRLLDFGLVKADDTTITRSGAFMGTPHYIAPEQARGLPQVDGRADLYSLGCILYRLLTGVLPYTAENPMAIALQHVRSPYPPMAERRPDVKVDPALEAIVRRLMEKEPVARYASAGELVRELELWLDEHTAAGARRPAEEPTTTIAPPLLVAPGEDKRRSWIPVSIAAALLSMGVGAAVIVGQVRSAPEGQAIPESIRTPAEPAPAEPPPAELAPAEPPPAEPAPAAPEAPRTKPRRAETRAPEKAEPTPKADPPAGNAGHVIVDGVRMDQDHAERALRFVNSATESELHAAGVYGRGVTIILQGRPFSGFEEFGETPYIGEKTIQSIADATR